MPVAPDLKNLKRRLDRYFWSGKDPEVLLLQQILSTHFFSAFDEVYVVGGLVRDFAREGRSGFRSDVDLVINAPASKVTSLARKLAAKRNRFGGYAYRTPPWKIDFWAMEVTWAAKNRHVNVQTIDDILKCTFFDWDAAIYDLKARKVICDPDYLDKLRNKEIEINLQPNPALEGNLLRAIRRMLFWSLTAGPKLEYFIHDYVDSNNFERLKKLEATIYRNSALGNFSSHEELFGTIFHHKIYKERKVRFHTQFLLPLSLQADVD